MTKSPAPGPQSVAQNKRIVIGLSIVYAAWLSWLAYVAWVNIQSGNQ